MQRSMWHLLFWFFVDFDLLLIFNRIVPLKHITKERVLHYKIGITIAHIALLFSSYLPILNYVTPISVLVRFKKKKLFKTLFLTCI